VVYTIMISVMKTRFILLFLIFISFHSLYSQNSQGSPAKEVRIGLFRFDPINFIDDSGLPSGLYPALIQEIAHKSHWKVRYVEGSFNEGLERLQNEEIDLMISVAWSEGRSEIMDYNQESVVELWGQVYTTPGNYLTNIIDLQGQTVGVMERDITGANLIKTAALLGITFKTIEYPSFHDVLRAIERGEVQAGTAPQHYGLRHLSDYNLVGTSILFSPFSIYFATKKGLHDDLLYDIDFCLSEWKQEKDSVYYNQIRDWMSPEGLVKNVIPLWIKLLLVITSLLIIIVSYINLLFGRNLKRRTISIREKESRYRSLVQQLNSIILRLSPDGRVLFVNDFGLSLLHIKKMDILQKNILTLELLPDGLTLESLKQPESLKQLDMVREMKIGGERLVIQWSLNTIGDDEGSLQEILCLGFDITDRVRMEQALKESEEKFTSFMKNIPASAFIMNDKGEHIYANPAAQSHLKKQKEFLLTEISQDEPNFLSKIRESEKKLFTGQSLSEKVEYEIMEKNSESVTRIEANLFPIVQSNGKILIGGIVFDVTEAREIEEQLNQSRKMQAIGELAGGIAHDFNNQLSGIMGYADLLTQGITDPRQEGYAKKLHNGIERASEVTKQLLIFSRKGKKETVSVNMNHLILELIDFLTHSIEKQIAIHFTERTEDSIIQGDPNLIQNALLNISINARDAIKGKGSLYFSTHKIVVDDKMAALQGYSIEKGPYLVVSVEDTGSGMPKEIKEKIFEPFFTTKDMGQGTGMGLAMVYSSMKDHLGNVTVQTTENKGTVFSLYFPCAPSKNKKEAIERISEEVQAQSLQIAIVDDEQMIREFLSLSLLEAGHRVALFEGGKQIIKAFKENHSSFDLVILDMIMPGMSGLETYQLLSEIHPEIPVLLSSGYSPKEELQAILKNTNVIYLQKPYSIGELHSAISSLINKIRSAEDSQGKTQDI
jgi:PAS domain S-box-containing protein